MAYEIGTVIAKHRKQNKISQADLSVRLEDYNIYVKTGAISLWEKNINTPTARQLLALCEILGITDIYSEFIRSNPDNLLAGLNETGIQKVRDYISLLLLSDQFRQVEEKPATSIRTMPVCTLAFSMGDENYFKDENFENRDFTCTIPSKAVLGVFMEDNSMEPKISKDQLMWIQKTASLATGEIGLFYLNGRILCRRLRINKQGRFLIAINKAWPSIQLQDTDTLITLGRILL